MFKVKHERDCDCVVAGFRWHKKGDGTAVGSLLLGLFDDAGALQHVGVCASFTDEKRQELVEFPRALPQECARQSSVESVGASMTPATKRVSACREARAAGARARICRGSRCGPNWWSRSPTSTCRAPASVTWRSFADGEPTRSRAIARTRNSKWFHRRSWTEIFAARPLSRALSARRLLRFAAFSCASFRHSRVGSSSGSGVSCGGRSASGTWRRLTRMRVQVEIGRAWNRPAHRRRREVRPPRRACSSIFPDPPARLPCWASSPPRSAASSSRGLLCADLARDGATRGASPSILRKCGGQGASPRPAASSLAASSSSFSSEPGRVVHAGVRIADLREALRNREHRKVGRIAIRDLVPVKRRGNARVGQRPHRICGTGGPVLRVLVVVEEHAVALLFPPFRTGQCGHAPLDCARQSNGRAAHLA